MVHINKRHLAIINAMRYITKVNDDYDFERFYDSIYGYWVYYVIDNKTGTKKYYHKVQQRR